MITKHEEVIVLDFGGQYTQLIARRVRELGVYCEIMPFHVSYEKIRAREPIGIILSGGPSSVYAEGAPHCDPRILDMRVRHLEDGFVAILAPDCDPRTLDVRVPVLGICYGFQLQAYFMGGTVAASSRREFGHARLDVTGESPLFHDLPRDLQVWMSHGDEVCELPQDFHIVARTENSIGAAESPVRNHYGIQFHPEVVHTPDGKAILKNFLQHICGAHGDWTMASFVESAIEQIRQQVGSGHAVCGLSGGVDSSVAATLVARAMGDRLTCLFVDNGLLRKNEFEDVLELYKREIHLNVTGINAADRFLSRLEGVTDPEQKRKIIGNTFIDVFQEEAVKLGPVEFLVQGTLYPDVIESTSVKGPSAVIKSHHNVGGLPEKMHLKLVEPLRELFKDEVRAVGHQLGLPTEIIDRHPFPGPGLAVRILGAITPERLKVLREADAIVIEEIQKANLYNDIWQAFAVLLPVSSVGVMGDERTYENTLAIRAVNSQDGMTADWVRIPYEVLARISSRVVSEVRGINRVVYDISSKPPSTIEWE